MVVQMLSLSGTPQADAADDLAVALTHALRNHSLAGFGFLVIMSCWADLDSMQAALCLRQVVQAA